MRRYLPILIVLFITCSYGASEELEEGGQSRDAITENSFEYIDTSEVVATENFTDKNTIIIFWADYWGLCRQELPVLEAELKNLEGEYDVLALAHSEYTPTLEWVKDNLKGNLRIGFSTPQLRDYFKVVGQPITIVLDTNGEIIFRDFCEIKFTNF